MILTRLMEYYDALAASGGASGPPPPGFSCQLMSFCVVLNLDGSLNSIASLLDEKRRPKEFQVPGAAHPSGQGINPGLLWDNAIYMLGLANDERKQARALRCFDAFRRRHLDLEAEMNHPAFSAVCRFLKDWDPSAATAAHREAVGQNFGVFRLAGEKRYVHELVTPEVAELATEPAPPGTTCLISGAPTRAIARLHEPKIKGVRGSQSSGALLVSFNDPAYNSYGKEQGANAPVSPGAAFKYSNALNHLLKDPRRRVSLGDATVTFWAERPNPLEDFLSDLLADGPGEAEAEAEDQERVRQARIFVTQLRDATRVGRGLDPARATRFYILGLAPSAARISIRFWIDSDVAELEARLGQHLRDIELAGWDGDRPPSLRRLINATGRALRESGRFRKFDSDTVAPALAGAFARSVLTGGPYPQTLLTAMLRRIRADGVVHGARCAAIKGCLVRNSRLRGNPLEVPVALDVNLTDPAYNAGRLFALLEKLQEDSAQGPLNATILDKYFSSASSTPATVFPLLLRLHQHHLRKLETPLKIHFERRIQGVVAHLTRFPARFGLEEQGQFAIGYYHQRQDLFTKKPEPKEMPDA